MTEEQGNAIDVASGKARHGASEELVKARPHFSHFSLLTRALPKLSSPYVTTGTALKKAAS